MFRATSWAGIAILCASAAGAGGQNPVLAPPPREKASDEAWLPKPGSDPGVIGGVRFVNFAANAPTIFPTLGIPDEALADSEKYWATFEKMCPRLFGKIVLIIEPTDDPLRKLLKARLHQGAFEFQLFHRVRGQRLGPPPNFNLHRDCLSDMQSVATELWAEQPKELIPWLEELLVASKDLERTMRIQLALGVGASAELIAARRLRLKIEAELWKAKNPK